MKNYFDLTGQVAIVTGGSSGLGVQFAKALANQGANIALVARREEKLKQVQEEIIKEYGVKVNYYPLDLCEFEKIPELVQNIKKDFGRIDILINNAGVADGTPAMEMSQATWLNLMNLNLNSVFFMAQEAAKVMKENNYGRIINLSSIHGFVGMKGFAVSAYTASKHGVKGMTKQLAVEFAPYGITVNAIGPAYFGSEMTGGFIETEGFQSVLNAYCPMARAGKEGELDTAILMFASPYSTFTTGQTLAIDGAWTAI